MPHQIAFRFEDGVTRFIEANPTETVADAAYRQGVNIPLDCRDGACGTCKCLAESGPFEMGEYIEDALSEDEAARGYVLTCQMRAKGDCVVQVPASSAVCRTPQAAVEAAIQEVRQLSPSTLSLTLKGRGARQAGLPAGAVREPAGARHRPDAGLLVQLAGAQRRGLVPDPQRAGRPHEQLPDGPRPAR